MRRLRLTGLIVLGLLLLAGIVALAGYLLARTQFAAGRLAAMAQGVAGQPVSVDALEIDYFPRPRLTIEGLELDPPEGFGAEPFMQARRISLGFRWGTLIRPAFEFTEVHLEGLVLRPARDASGRDNWTALTGRVIDFIGPGESWFSIDDLKLDDGRVQFRDARSGQRVDLSGIGVVATGVRPKQPFPLDLRAAAQLAPHIMHGALSGTAVVDPDHGRYRLSDAAWRYWLGGGALPLAGVDARGTVAAMDADTQAGRYVLRGVTANAAGVRAAGSLEATPGSVALSFTTEPFEPRGVANAVDASLPATRDPKALASARLALSGRLDGSVLKLTTLDATLDDTRLTGSGALDLAGAAPPKLRLEADRIDLDRYLPPTSGKARTAPQEGVQQALRELEKLDVDAVVTVGELRSAGAVLKGVKLVVEPNLRPGAAP
jgi:AsmA protein